MFGFALHKGYLQPILDGTSGVCTLRFLDHRCGRVLVPALARTRPAAWCTSRVDTPAPPLYTRPRALCDQLSSTHPSETPMQRILIGLLVLFTLGVLCVSSATEAQPSPTVSRVGWLSAGSPHGDPGIEAFRQGLRALGYVEGETLVLEARYAEG